MTRNTILPGMALILLLAGIALYLAGLPAFSHLGLSALTLAIVGGMLLGNTLYPHIAERSHHGVAFGKQQLLRLGIILYGCRLTLQDIAKVGTSGLIIDLLVLSSTFALSIWLGTRLFGLDKKSAILIGAGSSICGAAAVLATEPVVRGSAEKVAVAVATVVVFGTASMFLYPLLYPLALHWFGGDAHAFGVYTGSTVHEVAQVVAAARAASPDAESTAVIVKMIRVMLLAPFLIGLSAWMARTEPRHGHARSITVPWFAVLFVLMTALHSLPFFPRQFDHVLLFIDNLLLAMAMGALGLTTHVSALRRAGVKPLLLAGLLFVYLIVGGALINLAVSHLAML
ncbi:YeiH family putative sulfate export transporter [Paludibacterium purpuratum]|uniref:Putative integral membrane protein (TIGR00698 family) n=1 Tax=Paludibacterium purpuratum TaxID=1144873 RepID=A0A4R7BA49_9NEIS|nr:YeiH family protein [Paludibacterium purpuratum]TDR80725.1 putative integral membrane protein (TIGR00698 family) [Paludibacterium purpuratum]